MRPHSLGLIGSLTQIEKALTQIVKVLNYTVQFEELAPLELMVEMGLIWVVMLAQ